MPQHCFVAQKLDTTQFCRETVKYGIFFRGAFKNGTFLLKYAFGENDSGLSQDRRKPRKLCHPVGLRNGN